MPGEVLGQYGPDKLKKGCNLFAAAADSENQSSPY